MGLVYWAVTKLLGVKLWTIILSMVIAGALAGMGACFYYLNSIEFKYVSQYSSLPAYGFNGIASAFLANCSPTGIIVSSVFIRWLNTGGDFLTKCGLNRYIADIVIAIIIYLASITNIVREIIVKYRKKKSQEKEVSKADGTVIEKEIKPDTLVIEDGAETIKEEEPKVEEVAKDE